MLLSNRFWRTTKLQTRIFLLTMSMTVASLACLAVFSAISLDYALETQVGKRSVEAAQAIATMPLVIQAVEKRDKGALASTIEPLRAELGATYIIVTNNRDQADPHFFQIAFGEQGRAAHQHSLQTGKSYIEFSQDPLGPSMIGEAPVINHEGVVTGSVIVDFLELDVQEELAAHNYKMLFFFILAIAACALTSKYLAAGVKRAIFNLEPEQIGRMFSEIDAIVESVREALISLDRRGKITKVNQRTFELLGLKDDNDTYPYLRHFLQRDALAQALNGRESVWDLEVSFADKVLLVTITPLVIAEKFSGHVISLRQKDELEKLSRELSKTQNYSELLRAQTHEHSNKLHTIYGMLQAGSIEDAMALISKVNEDQQKLISCLVKTVSDPAISGLLIGKFNRAKELGLSLELDMDSSMNYIASDKLQDRLITIVGNILDNAMEASLRKTNSPSIILLSMSDIGNDLIFEVEDFGPGFSQQEKETAFNKGGSIKKEPGHGFGLFLVKSALDKINGLIEIENKAAGGAIVTVYIPKGD